jgi:hypothetical protein
MPDEQERLRRAREHIDAVRGFYVHAIVYVITNLGLALVDWLSDPVGWWFYWPLLGWGIGLASHGFSVFGAFGLFGPRWEEKQIQKYLDNEAKRGQ